MQKILHCHASVNHYVISITTGLLILFLTIGLFTPAFVQAQKDRPGKEFSPSLILVPNGMAVVSSTGADGATLRVVDITQFGNLWIPANYAPNYIATAGQMPMIQNWSKTSFPAFGGPQSVHPVAVKGDGTRIYAGASGVIGNNKTPNIFMIGPGSTTPVIIATLPLNAGSGIKAGVAGLDLDETHNQLLAANYADGMIYRLDANNGTILGQFDPLAPFVPGPTALPPYGERVNTVAYNKVENRVYYSIWGFNGSSGSNTIRSVGLDGAGNFNAVTDRLEITLSSSQTPAGDIEFSVLGSRMLIGEQPLFQTADGLNLTAHNGRVLEYIGGTGAWTIDATIYGSGLKYNIGIGGRNCRGGVAWAYQNITGSGVISGHDSFIMSTGDALRLESGPSIPTVAVYGLQYTPATGGGAGGSSVGSNSLIADIDYSVASGDDKTVYGDVDIRRNLNPTAALVSVSGRVLGSNGNGLPGIYVVLTDLDGNTRSALTNAFGYYGFDNVLTDQNYVVQPSSKQHSFEPQLITVLAEMTDVDFHELK